MIELHVGQTGELSVTITGQSTAAALTQAREIIPDIDERFAAFAANFQPRGTGDAGLPAADAGNSGTGAGTQRPQEAGRESEAEDTGESQPQRVLDAGERVEEAEEAVVCSLCAGPVTKDWAEITKRENGQVLCPPHTA